MQILAVTDQDPRPFAELLRERRLRLGLSQLEAAREIGASEKSWRRWEKGQPVDGRFREAIRERFGVDAGPPVTPEAEVVKAVGDLELALASIRESLSRATNVRADIILRRPDGATVLIEVKAFRDGLIGTLEDDVIDLITAAAHDAGWTVHIAP